MMAVAPLPQYRFTVKQYHRMIETGVLTGDDRVELLEGWVVPKMPHNPPHDGTISLATRRFSRLLTDDWIIRVQSAITTRGSEPEPDVAVVSGPEEIYLTRHHGPSDVGMLLEVSASTLHDDRRIMGRIYARARIPIYWIVNLIDRHIEVYTNPKAGRNPAYADRQDYSRSQAIPLIIGGRQFGLIPVRELIR
jgi:Uma2 family endonuclease